MLPAGFNVDQPGQARFSGTVSDYLPGTVTTYIEEEAVTTPGHGATAADVFLEHS